jgi:succinate dehydrogenase / fumarate reductase flavoprotein subunit
LADGYFVIPYTIGDYLATADLAKIGTGEKEFDEAEKELRERTKRLINNKGKKTVSELHRELGMIMWDYVGMSRSKKGLEEALKRIPELRKEFWENVYIPGDEKELNKNLEFAFRVADFLELGELMALDALKREESCGGHFREEYQTPEGEALRNDEKFAHVAAWEFKGDDQKPERHVEELKFENVKLTQRSYK